MKTRREIESMRGALAALDAGLSAVQKTVKAGIPLAELDRVARLAVTEAGAIPVARRPGVLGTSLNDEILDASPGDRVLSDGDVLKLSLAVNAGGWHASQTWSYAVGFPSAEDRDLMDAGLAALARALGATKPGVMVSEVSRAIQDVALARGCSTNRQYGGHGIGRELIEPPFVACSVGWIRRADVALACGHVLSVHAILHAGSPKCRELPGGSGAATRDGSRAVDYSHMVAVTEDGVEVLTRARTLGGSDSSMGSWSA